MFPSLNERPSVSPFVERIWTTQSEKADSFISIATAAWSLVVAKRQGRTSISFHGPLTVASRQEFPPDAQWFGIEFKLGAFVPAILPGALVDSYVVLPTLSHHTFALSYSQWEIPHFDNADVFVGRLARAGILGREPVADSVQRDESQLSLRALQYRFLRSTGLPLRTVRQIERARYAARLLQRGTSILDTVDEAGYSDQPHLTRSLKHFIGLTPAQIPAAAIVGL